MFGLRGIIFWGVLNNIYGYRNKILVVVVVVVVIVMVVVVAAVEVMVMVGHG